MKPNNSIYARCSCVNRNFIKLGIHNFPQTRTLLCHIVLDATIYMCSNMSAMQDMVIQHIPTSIAECIGHFSVQYGVSSRYRRRIPSIRSAQKMSPSLLTVPTLPCCRLQPFLPLLLFSNIR